MMHKHEWVKSGHGNDLICKLCGYAAMQATLPSQEIGKQITERLGRGLKKELGIQSPSAIWNDMTSKALKEAKRSLEGD